MTCFGGRVAVGVMAVGVGRTSMLVSVSSFNMPFGSRIALRTYLSRCGALMRHDPIHRFQLANNVGSSILSEEPGKFHETG
jgi:hypothetical protein